MSRRASRSPLPDLALESVSDLRRSVRGEVVTPTGRGYDAARLTFNALVDRRPAAIVRCARADDVATALDFARKNALAVAVRGGGHNPAGHAVCDGGIVIDLSPLNQVEVDARARLARAGGGTNWKQFDAAGQAHGLVTPGGVVGTTGVAGLTLGGGIGHLLGRFGLTCDNLVGAEVVTADGRMVAADAETNPDLFWGLRGGGGNFGVVTTFTFRLHPLSTLLGGLITYRLDAARDVLRRFAETMASAPDHLTCQAQLTGDENGVPVLQVAVCYTGADEDPSELRRLRTAPGVISDAVDRIGYLDLQGVFDPPFGRSRHYWKGHFLSGLPGELIDELVDRFLALGRVPGSLLIESIHGAAARAPLDSMAVHFRDARFNVSAQAVWERPEDDAAEIAWARETAAALEPYSPAGGGYVNYMQQDEPLDRVRAAFGPEKFERLRALKRKFDPENVFALNQNIPPA
ncbi:MAG: FAD-binding oxidoreductase [Gaiellaceae bacterium]